MVSVSRRGRRLVYKLIRSETPERTVRTIRPPSSSAPAAEVGARASSAPPPVAGPVLHKLAPGEAVILHVGEQHVETATNVHGRIVVERHPRVKG